MRLISERNEDRGSRGRAAKLVVRREGRQQRASCVTVKSRRPAFGLGLRRRENAQTYVEDRGEVLQRRSQVVTVGTRTESALPPRCFAHGQAEPVVNDGMSTGRENWRMFVDAVAVMERIRDRERNACTFKSRV